jgi:hypothetical protein
VIKNFNYNTDILIHIISIILLSSVFFFIGGLLNKINKTENAEKAFYFKISQTIFKYSLLAMAVAISGILFYQNLYPSIFYIILGIISGGFVAFLVINFIIYKNIREVFNGFRKFGIFIIAASLIMCVFSFDIFGIDKYIPEVSKVESVELDNRSPAVSYHMYTRDFKDESIYNNYYDRYSRIIKDSETIELINNVFKIAMKSIPAKTYDFAYSTNFDSYKYYWHLSGRNINYNLKNGSKTNKIFPSGFNFKDTSDTNEYLDAVKLLLQDKS